MKKAYEAPELLVEKYVLDTSIAASCSAKLNHSDQDCYEDYMYGGVAPFSLEEQKQSFVDEKVCDCYHTAGGEGFFTS